MNADKIELLSNQSASYQELLGSSEKRKALAKVVMRVFSLWKLDTTSQLALLGLGTSSRAMLTKYRTGETPLQANQDTLQRAGYIIGIYQLLNSLYPKNPEIRDSWVKLKNPKLENSTPLDIMLNGIPDLKKIYALLQYQMLR